MRFVAGALILLLAASAAAGDLGDLRDGYSLQPGESATLNVLGATAAWAIDPAVVDASAHRGSVVLTAKAPGRTHVVVTALGGERTFDVIVHRPVRAAPDPASTRGSGVVETRYSTAAREVQSSTTMIRETAAGRTEIHAAVVQYTGTRPDDGTRSALPSASYRIVRKGRELTLLDRTVDHSPLTLSATPVRGLHYLDRRWSVHAGYTAWASHRSFLLPVDREAVAGLSYSLPLDAGSAVRPSVFTFQGQGTVLSLLWELERRGLSARTEAAYGGGPGFATQVDYRGDRDRVRIDTRYRPSGFAAVAPGEVRGLLADASWTRRWEGGSTAAVSVSATDYARIDQSALAATVDLELRASRSVALIGGGSWGRVAGATSVTIPLGVRLDLARGNIGALARHARQSATNRGGTGLRVFGRYAVGGLRASAWFDRQQNAPTLDLVYRERPDLGLALDELGLEITSVADLARALRESATLAALGFVEGISIDLTPTRTQAGFELAWLSPGPARHSVRLRLLRGVSESVATTTKTTIASIEWARRLTEATDIFARHSFWRIERDGLDPVDRPFVEAGFRHRFDELPSFLGAGRGTVDGVVFLDENLDGVSDGQPLGGAEIELDGDRRTTTAADGRFAFPGVGAGRHRVVARLPGRPEAFFTSPSSVEVHSGETVAFGVALTPARIQGSVTSDIGEGLAGVRIMALGSTRGSTVTDSEGRYALALAPGEWRVSLAYDSIPVGFSGAGAGERTIRAERSVPTEANFVLQALRSVRGAGAAPDAAVTVEPLGVTLRADREGRFSLRSLQPGALTFISGDVRRHVIVPRGPGTVTVDFGGSQPAATATVAAADEGELPARAWVVQLGAFRVRSNAVDAAARSQRSGVAATLHANGGLTLVRTAPVSTRRQAQQIVATLAKAGIDACVLPSTAPPSALRSR